MNSETIKKAFLEILEEGGKILQACQFDGTSFYRWPPLTDYFRLRARALNLVKRVCSENSDHYQELLRIAQVNESETHSQLLPQVIGVVQATLADFEGGLLFDLRKIIESEILGDFIDQSEYLLSNGYYQAAASLAGGVLEDALRKLCDKHNITYPDKTKIDSLNADLAKNGVYDKLIQKRITAAADVRNKADHGQHGQFKQEDVEDLVKFVKRFCADYLR